MQIYEKKQRISKKNRKNLVNMKIICNFAVSYFLVGGTVRLLVAGIFYALTLQTYGSVTPCKFVMDLLLPIRSMTTGSAEPFLFSASEQIFSEMSNQNKICPQGNNSTLPATYAHETGIQTFSFEGTHDVQVVTINNEPWFVAVDVCKVLGLPNATNALLPLYHDEKFPLKLLRGRGERVVNVVNESGLYTLIMGSYKPNAKQFRKWVTSEVLPSIRKTGQYATPTVISDNGRETAYWKNKYDQCVDIMVLMSESQKAMSANYRDLSSLYRTMVEDYTRLQLKLVKQANK